MTGHIRTSLQRFQGRSVATPEEIHAMKKKAWHEKHLLTIPMADMEFDDWTWQMLENIGNKLYGKRSAS